MILGVDLGNYYTKSSKGVSFLSKVSCDGGIENKDFITVENKKIYLGEGEFDTEYRKAYRENILYLLQGAIDKSTTDKRNKVVVGLPLSQYKEDKEYLINRIIQSKLVDDVDVLPEGVMAVPNDYQGILIDIGGRTTDICLLIIEGNKRRIRQPISLPLGIQNLENNFINSINSTYGLDLKVEDSNRILANGLFIYGERKKVNLDSFKEFVENIVRRVQVDYSLKTNDVVLIGGGAEKLYKPFKNRIPQAYLVKNSFMANAIAYGEYAKEIFR
ncbi:ParM/StbA family protein [Clostridium tertium]|uniref:ParM/StbA family protein n=1 Tax=Clostridium tertium TaxID=1559 RepID=A0A9X3XR16_9CLOT|nr:ParM/StbA family protein [Clostridium tertium]MDC4241662.1 ParM/StbA family protein [Clostridium tertium]